ncbi:hypothetical protein TNCV_3841271 [Trichonephila clavipes]|nr:hypothetical protein TNCV_3841271 [Trichonephila clavipes]
MQLKAISPLDVNIRERISIGLTLRSRFRGGVSTGLLRLSREQDEAVSARKLQNESKRLADLFKEALPLSIGQRVRENKAPNWAPHRQLHRPFY